MNAALAALDYASVLVFALTGALVASRAQLDIIGFAFLACLTAVGGGTIRDVLLDRNPVFWVAQPSYLGVAVAAGAGVAQSLGQPAPVVVIMGMITGCMGGLMRDVVVGQVPLVLKQGELYVSAAFAGAGAFVAASWVGLPALAILGLSACATFVLRAGSIRLGWRLPVYKPRPPRS